jgi:hypothetical protein
MNQKPALVPSPDVTRYSKMGAPASIFRNVCLVHPPENARRDASSGSHAVAREDTGDDTFASVAVRYVRNPGCIDRENLYGSKVKNDVKGGNGNRQQIVESEAVEQKMVIEKGEKKAAEHEEVNTYSVRRLHFHMHISVPRYVYTKFIHHNSDILIHHTDTLCSYTKHIHHNHALLGDHGKQKTQNKTYTILLLVHHNYTPQS